MFGRRGSSVALSTSLIALGICIGAAAPAQAAWSTPVKPPAACTPTTGLNVARNAAGTWVLVGAFTQSDGSSAVESCTSSDGVSWSGPSMIGPGNGPSVAVAPSGRAVVAFHAPYPALNMEASVRPPGGNWSVPVAISSGAFSGQVLIKMDGSGNTIAVWAGTRATSPLAMASLAANSTTWTPMNTLAPAGTGSLGLATNSSGGVVIGFRTNTPDRIEAISGTILGGFGQPVVLGTAYGTAVRPIEVALNDAGEAVLGWVTDDFAKVITRSPGGTWSAATQLAGINAEGIGVAIDAAGNAVAGFGQDQATFGITAVYASKLPAGGAWGPATLLSTLDARGKVAVGGDPTGTVVVSWVDNAGNVEALTIPPGGGFGPGTVVGAGPFTALTVYPGQAMLVIGAGIAKETVN
jgi:hypothetical protein